MSLKRIVYECGCTSMGDAVSPFCPIHGDPIAEISEIATVDCTYSCDPTDEVQ